MRVLLSLVARIRNRKVRVRGALERHQPRVYRLSARILNSITSYTPVDPSELVQGPEESLREDMSISSCLDSLFEEQPTSSSRVDDADAWTALIDEYEAGP